MLLFLVISISQNYVRIIRTHITLIELFAVKLHNTVSNRITFWRQRSNNGARAKVYEYLAINRALSWK